MIDLRKFEAHVSLDAKLAILQVQEYLNKSINPFYFPEYTLHGVYHINNLIEYSWELLHPDTPISDDAISVLILGICLHDIGMFITPKMFKSLLVTDDWQAKFDEYIAKLKNMPSSEIDRIYGAIVGNDDEKNELAERRINMLSIDNKYTVGEFIRRYHHEISYLIAVKGFPDKSEHFCEKIAHKDLIGFIAMGHRGDIRRIMDEKIKTDRDENFSPYGIPISLLMSVCWLADELDDKSESRAPKHLQDHINVLNRFSQTQWADNRCVPYLSFTTDKPSIKITTVPVSTTQYLRMDEYIRKVQYTLDSCWAILTEYCGKEQQTKYKLTRHRIVSDIYKATEKASYNFLPADASLKIKPNIAKLLISPLYGDAPRYGVRELLSNSIDACRERLTINNLIPPKIILNLDTSRKEFTITDNGIGMTDETIVDYFMTIGASFRDSDAWNNKFKSNESTTIMRSGRFGVGALAAYLIGEEISVYTRMYDGEYSYSFSVLLDGAIPDVIRTKDDSFFGTKIVIKNLNESIFSRRDYDGGANELDIITRNLYDAGHDCPWYIYDDIHIEYQIDSRPVSVPRHPSSFSFPIDRNMQHKYQPNSNESILWWFGRYGDGGSLICANGIFVQVDYHDNTKFNKTISALLKRPYVFERHLSFDFVNSHSALSTSNLTLQRNSLVGDAYAKNIALDVIYRLLTALKKAGNVNPLLEKNQLGVLICKNGYLPIYVAEYCNIEFQIVKVSADDINTITEAQMEKLLGFAKSCTEPIIFTESNPAYDDLGGTFTKGEGAGIYISDDISVSASYRVKPVNGLHLNPLVEGLLIHVFGIDRCSSLADCVIPFSIQQ